MSDVFQKPAGQEDPRGRLDPEGFADRVAFRTWEPPDDLAAIVEHGWCVSWEGVDTPFHNEEVMHRPYIDLFVDDGQAGIQGTFRGRRTYVASGAGRVIGIRFRPGGFTAVWQGDIASLQERMLDLATAFPEIDRGWIEAIDAMDEDDAITALFELVRWLQPQADDRIDLVNAVIAAAETDDTLTTVVAVAARFDRSERWVQQLFRDMTGIGLKWFLRRTRLLAAARLVRDDPSPDWTDIAYRFGYSSQQHFITEFRQETGKTPVQYWRNPGTEGSA